MCEGGCVFGLSCRKGASSCRTLYTFRACPLSRALPPSPLPPCALSLERVSPPRSHTHTPCSSPLLPPSSCSRPKFPRTRLTAGIPSFRSLVSSRRSLVPLAREGRRVSAFAVSPRSSSARSLPVPLAVSPLFFLWFPSVNPCRPVLFSVLRLLLPATSPRRSLCHSRLSLCCPTLPCRLIARPHRLVCSLPVSRPVGPLVHLAPCIILPMSNVTDPQP